MSNCIAFGSPETDLAVDKIRNHWLTGSDVETN